MARQPKVREQPVPSESNRKETLSRFAVAHPGLPVKEAELGTLLYGSASGLTRAVELHLQRYGMPAGRFAVLLTLRGAERGQQSPSELADRLAVTRPTVTGIVDGLEKAGLVRRGTDPENRRSQTVALTPKGRRAIDEVAPDHFRRLAAAARTFSKQELVTLRKAVPLLVRFGEVLVGGEKP